MVEISPPRAYARVEKGSKIHEKLPNHDVLGAVCCLRARMNPQRAATAAAAPAMTVPVVRLRMRMARGLVKSRRARAASAM